jgi:hypothetical protein
MRPTTRAPVFTAPRVGANGDTAVRDRPTALREQVPDGRLRADRGTGSGRPARPGLAWPGPGLPVPSRKHAKGDPSHRLGRRRDTRARREEGHPAPDRSSGHRGEVGRRVPDHRRGPARSRRLPRGLPFDGKWRYAFEFPSQFGRRGSVETTGKTEATITSEYTTTGQQPPPGSSRSVTPTRHASPAATGRPVPTGTRGSP